MTLYIYFYSLLGLWMAWVAYWIASVVYEGATNRTKETERRVQGTGFIFIILLFVMLSPFGLRGPLGAFYFVMPQALKAALPPYPSYTLNITFGERGQATQPQWANCSLLDASKTVSYADCIPVINSTAFIVGEPAPPPM